MRATEQTISIIGAGTGGLAMAHALLHHGVSPANIRVYEKNTEIKSEIGAGLGLTSAVEVLRSYGFQDQMERFAAPVRRARFMTDRGKSLAVSDSEWVLDKLGIARSYVMAGVERAAFLAMLADALPEGILVLGKSLDRIEQDVEGATCIFEDGDRQRSTIVIGADGIHSRVRDLLFGHEKPIFSGHCIWYGVSTLPEDLFRKIDGEMHMVFGSGWNMGAYAIHRPDRKVMFFRTDLSSEVTVESWENEAAKDVVRSKVGGKSEVFDALVEHADRLMNFGLYYRRNLSQSWHCGRVVLMGDAAHATLPYMSQGANLAIEDAACLSHLLQDHLLEEAFRTFHRKREPKTTKMVQQAVTLGRFDLASTRLGIAARDSFYRVMGATGMITRTALGFYRSSFVEVSQYITPTRTGSPDRLSKAEPNTPAQTQPDTPTQTQPDTQPDTQPKPPPSAGQELPWRLPPGPPPQRLLQLGGLLLKDRLAFTRELQQSYGDMVRVPLGIILSHPEAIRHVLVVNADNYIKGQVFADFGDSLLGNGLAMRVGSEWKKRRRWMNPHFQPNVIGNLSEGMLDGITSQLDLWAGSATRGETVELNKDVHLLSGRVLCRALLGASLSEGELKQVHQELKWAISFLSLRAIFPIGLLKQPRLPQNRRLARATARIRELVQREIQAERNRPQPSSSLIATMIQSEDPDTGERMSDDTIYDEVIGLILGGVDTVGDTLFWALHALAKQPEVRARAQAQVDEVLGARAPSHDDVPKLDYLRRIIDETLRFYTPTWSTAREPINEDTIGAYRIPANKSVLLNYYLAHRHPDVWESPESFDPDRFLPERFSNTQRLAYFPFGGGPRRCIGSHFALLELTLALAAIVQRFELKFVDLDGVQPYASFSITAKDPAFVRFEERSTRKSNG